MKGAYRIFREKKARPLCFDRDLYPTFINSTRIICNIIISSKATSKQAFGTCRVDSDDYHESTHKLCCLPGVHNMMLLFLFTVFLWVPFSSHWGIIGVTI